jgi:hypothetical protein
MVLTVYSDHLSFFLINISFTIAAMHVGFQHHLLKASPPDFEKATKTINLIENYKHNKWLL